jgi:hypothetical protein
MRERGRALSVSGGDSSIVKLSFKEKANLAIYRQL